MRREVALRTSPAHARRRSIAVDTDLVLRVTQLAATCSAAPRDRRASAHVSSTHVDPPSVSPWPAAISGACNTASYSIHSGTEAQTANSPRTQPRNTWYDAPRLLEQPRDEDVGVQRHPKYHITYDMTIAWPAVKRTRQRLATEARAMCACPPMYGRSASGTSIRAVGLLVVLHHRDERAADRETRAVQRVHELGLALRVAKARLHAPRLERLAVRARRDLAIGVLRRAATLRGRRSSPPRSRCRRCTAPPRDTAARAAAGSPRRGRSAPRARRTSARDARSAPARPCRTGAGGSCRACPCRSCPPPSGSTACAR